MPSNEKLLHPTHFFRVDLNTEEPWPVAKPPRKKWWTQLIRERQCRKNGGHWWHAGGGMIDWFCCQCGAERDGVPKDGQ